MVLSLSERPLSQSINWTENRPAGQQDLAVLATDHLADLRGTPAGVLALELQDQVLDLKGEFAALAVGSATAIRETFQAAVLVAGKDLVAGLSGDIELPAQYRHLLAFQQPSDEPQLLVHLATLLPRHLRYPRKCPKVLSMCSEYFVTYVPEGTP
jgi:hypothetical protein